MVAFGPVDEVEVEVVLQIGRVQDFIWLFADLPHLLLWAPLAPAEALSHRPLAAAFARLAGGLLAKGHDLVVGLEVDLLEDALAEELLVGGAGGLAGGAGVFDLEGTGADFGGDEAVALGLGLHVLLVF